MFYLSWAFPFSALYSLVFSLSLGLSTLSVIATLRLTNARARSCRVRTSEKRRLPLYTFDRKGYKRLNVCRLDSHLLRVQTSGRNEAPLQVIELVKTGLRSLRRLMKLRKPYDYKKENWQA